MNNQYILTLLDKKEIAKDTMAFYFSKPKDFSYKAGQSIELTLINPPERDAEGSTRSFSIGSSSFEDHIMIAIRVRNTAFKRYLKKAPLGTQVTMSGPYSSFTLHQDAKVPAVFVTGGIGITPLYSIFKEIVHENFPYTIFLFYSNKTREQAAFLDELQTLAQRKRNFTFVPTLTQEQPTNWVGKTGRISQEMLLSSIPDITHSIYYISGSIDFVESMIELLEKMGVDENAIRREDFPGY